MLKAALKGVRFDGLEPHDRVHAGWIEPGVAGTQMHFEASIEILGKLATLGAVPIRRRTTQVFAEFAKNIQGQFEAGSDSA